jgi:ribosomal protein S1
MPPEISSDLENNFQIGQTVKAKIIKIENDRASFSILDLKPDPWVLLVKKYKVGDIFLANFSSSTKRHNANFYFWKIWN